MHLLVSEYTPNDRFPQTLATDGVLVGRPHFLKLIVAGIAVVAATGRVGGASGGD